MPTARRGACVTRPGRPFSPPDRAFRSPHSLGSITALDRSPAWSLHRLGPFIGLARSPAWIARRRIGLGSSARSPAARLGPIVSDPEGSRSSVIRTRGQGPDGHRVHRVAAGTLRALPRSGGGGHFCLLLLFFLCLLLFACSVVSLKNPSQKKATRRGKGWTFVCGSGRSASAHSGQANRALSSGRRPILIRGRGHFLWQATQASPSH
jgi:hypothetical protein